MTSNLDYDGVTVAALNVTDFAKSIAWYQDVLGLELLYKMDEMGWCEFKTATKGLNIGLSVVEEAKNGGGATLTLGVRDIAAARAQLEAKDVRFDGDTQTVEGLAAVATFYDPDGNQLMLAQDLSEG